MLAVAIAAMLGGASLTPAFAKDKDGRHDNGRHKGWHKGEHSQRYDYRQPDRYYYDAPVYAPRPVYIAPQPSPGISLFFPLDIRHR